MTFWHAYWHLSHIGLGLFGGIVLFFILFYGRKHHLRWEHLHGRKLWWRPKYTYPLLGLVWLVFIGSYCYDSALELSEAFATGQYNTPLLTSHWLRSVPYALLSGNASYVLCRKLLKTRSRLSIAAWLRSWLTWGTLLGLCIAFGLCSEALYALWLRWAA